MDLDQLTPEQLERLAALVFGSNKSLNFGPFILGAVVDSLFCGLLLMQYGAYLSSANKDALVIKSLVAFVVAMVIWSTALVWAWIWELFVENFGTYRTFFSVKYLSWFFVINSAAITAVQTFFGLRAWKLGDRSLLLGATMLTLVLAGLGGGVAVKVMFARYDMTVYANKLKVPSYICLSCTAAADIMITGIILNYLMRQHTINKHINHLLSRLTRVTFGSQLPSTLIHIVLLIIYTIKSDSFVIVPLIWVAPKLYGISLLHTLNIRDSLRPTDQGTEMTPEGCRTSATGRFHNEGMARGNSGPGDTVNISSWRVPTARSVSLNIIDDGGFDTGRKCDENLWHDGTDKVGPASILSDERTEGYEGPSKVALV